VFVSEVFVSGVTCRADLPEPLKAYQLIPAAVIAKIKSAASPPIVKPLLEDFWGGNGWAGTLTSSSCE
jgi:hypothetical protein